MINRAFVILVLACCGALTVTGRAQSSDEKELYAYRLTLPTVMKVAAATKALADEMAQDPTVKEMARIQAEIDELDKKDELTEAESDRMERLQTQLDKLEEAYERKNQRGRTDTLSEMEAEIKRQPAAMRALAKEGLTPREYALTIMALIQAALVEGFSEGKADLSKLPPGVNPENVKFVRQHKAELASLQGLFNSRSRR